MHASPTLLRFVRGAAFATAVAVALCAGAVTLRAEGRVRADGGKDFELDLSSGGTVAASWWYESIAGGPGAVLLVSSAEEREQWGDVVRLLRARNFNVLAVVVPELDPARPAGAAAPSLSALAAVTCDAASFLVRRAGVDAGRVGVAGGGACGLVALDAARRHPDRFHAAVAAGPDRASFEVSQFVAGAPEKGSPAALLALRDATADDVADLFPDCRSLVYESPAERRAEKPATRKQRRPLPVDGSAHAVAGLAWLRGVPLGLRTLVSFLDAKTGSKRDRVVLDGLVDEESAPGGPWTRAIPVGDGEARVWAYRSGKRLVFGGYAPASAQALRIDVAGVDDDGGGPSRVSSEWFRRYVFDLGTERLAWFAQVPIAHPGARQSDQRPEIRVVRCAGGVSFEGEWTGASNFVSEGGRAGDTWRALAFVLPRVPKEERGDPSGDLSKMSVVVAR